MADVVVLAVVLICLCAAVIYIAKEKKKGTRCIGCPSAGTCAAKRKAGSGCGCGSAESSCECHTDK